MAIKYYAFRDAETTMRFEVTDKSFVCDVYRPGDGFWTHSPDLADYILFDPGEIRPISRDEADARTDGHIDEPAKAFRPPRTRQR